MMKFTLQIGKYELTRAYSDSEDSIAIYVEESGEGADFSVSALEEVIDKFYKENF